MWNYIQLAVQIPTAIPEAEYFLKSLNTPLIMNILRCIAAGGALIMLGGIYYYGKKNSASKKEG